MPPRSSKVAAAAEAVAAATEKVETMVVEIVSPVLHDGERLAVGAVREIEKLAAEALIKLGAAKPAPIAAPAPAAEATEAQ